MKAWNPAVSGTIVGLLQFPVRYLTDDGLGSSTASMTLVGSIFGLLDNK